MLKTKASQVGPRTASSRIKPELLTDQQAAVRQRLDGIAWLFDRSIKVPGINFRIGADALLGLIPGLGDILSAVVSTYLMAEASRMGASKATLLRMGGNIALDTIVGAVPLLGDLFDMAFKANTRNVNLLNEHLTAPDRSRKTNTSLMVAIAIGLFALVCGSLFGLVMLLGWIASLIFV